jgi:hypothetical protein
MNNTNTPAPVSLAALAAEIAAALPGTWNARPVHPDATERNGNQYLTRSDGLQLFLAGSSGGWAAKGRVRVQFNRPRNAGNYVRLYSESPNYGGVKDPEITAAETKAPAIIAADIARRLLPEAETVFAMANAQIERDTNAANAHEKTAGEIAAACGREIEKDHHRGGTRKSFCLLNPKHGEEGGRYALASLDVRGGDSVRIEVDATRAQALALIAFLKSPAYANA